MRTERVRTTRKEESVVVCRKNVFSGVLASMAEHLRDGGGILFTDSNVYALYRKEIETYLAGVFVHVMTAGEAHKSETTLFSLLRAMAEAGLRRNSVLIALGGGVVGDIGGLAASLYMRGISCIQVPTTLLAQVDSSVGGKTAVDFCGVKNLIGSFHQPSWVYADPVFFKTLPVRELRCGLGEIIKHGALCSSIFGKLLQNEDRLFDLGFLAEIVPMNIAFKASVVRLDPMERGVRKSLNLGHTTAHAVELSGSTLSHGECVLLGMMIEERIAARYRDCDTVYLKQLDGLCGKALGKIPQTDFSEETARHALLDKKNRTEGNVLLTVSCRAGTFELLELPFAEYAKSLKEIGESLC